MRDAEKVTFAYGNKLPFKIRPDVESYGVMIAFYNNGQVNTLKYKVNLRWIEKDNISYLVVIERTTGVYLNDEEPDLMVYNLAEEVASVLYPMTLLVDESGVCVGIHNFSEIKKRWEEKKDKIREYYTGNCLEKYLSLNEQAVQNERALFESMRKDWFIQGYFNSLYRYYSKELQIERRISFPILLYADAVNYQITQQVGEYLDKENHIHIELAGQLAEERSKNDLENELNFPQSVDDEKATGDYYAFYNLESKYHTIDSFMLNCSLELEADRKMSMVVTHMQNTNQDSKKL